MRVITIRVYRGERLSYNENGESQNENYPVALQEGREFEKFASIAPRHGYLKIDFVGVMEVSKNGVEKEASKAVVESYRERVGNLLKVREVESIKSKSVDDLVKRLDKIESEKNLEIEELKKRNQALLDRLEEMQDGSENPESVKEE